MSVGNERRGLFFRRDRQTRGENGKYFFRCDKFAGVTTPNDVAFLAPVLGYRESQSSVGSLGSGVLYLLVHAALPRKIVVPAETAFLPFLPCSSAQFEALFLIFPFIARIFHKMKAVVAPFSADKCNRTSHASSGRARTRILTCSSFNSPHCVSAFFLTQYCE